eukprot:TRINITY_DN21852_c0_g1_i1.p1 TRINITY_DN21852_c0_g1~~TRINITY_DN21852_c0_g1_i1.p1  ORF type:complete len:265 (-),score=22.38 TRINITY_DN21852_c0_g1_i1:123-917(-)
MWRILTFNIWFSDYEMVKRMTAIGDIILSKQPNLIALQEMTAQHWEICSSLPAFQSYHWSAPPQDQPYYTLIGSLTPFVMAPTRLPFETSLMGRDLLYGTTIQTSSQSAAALAFATSHLESLTYAQARKSQMHETFHALRSYPDVVFCGDTNINEAIDGKVALPSPWKDAWTELRPSEPGYSFDVQRNAMMKRFDGWAVTNNARLRFDRFWVKLSNYSLRDIELIDASMENQDDVWPSDHFGLLLTIEPGKACQDSSPSSCNVV